MSIDRYFSKLDGRWVRVNAQESSPEFWVDICHGKNVLVDERYHFPDFASALDFCDEGWKQRQFMDDDGCGCGLDHSGLYAHGRLVCGLSLGSDEYGFESGKLARILGEFAKHIMGWEADLEAFGAACNPEPATAIPTAAGKDLPAEAAVAEARAESVADTGYGVEPDFQETDPGSPDEPK
jgi:hypothetical protein